MVGVIDGTVDLAHPGLALQPVRFVGTTDPSPAPGVWHGTLVVAALAARPTAAVPGLCPGCTFLVRPVAGVDTPPASPAELAAALDEITAAGARVVNISLALGPLTGGRTDASGPGIRRLLAAVDEAARRGAVVVAAAGNDGRLGGSPLVRHPWVIPVVALGARGRPLPTSTLGRAIGRSGLSAPVLPGGLTGSSAAAPAVTGAVALLWSLFPAASAGAVRYAITRVRPPGARTSVVPPPLDPGYAYGVLRAALA